MTEPSVDPQSWAFLLDAAAAWRPGADRPCLPDGPNPSEAARDLSASYLSIASPAGRSLALAQLGQSLDGRIATHSGQSHYVNGPDSIVHLHRLRALVDAVVVGVGTALADDPRLTVRAVPGTNPVRVIIDPDLRAPAGLKAFTDGAAETLVICRRALASRGDAASGVRLIGIAPDAAGALPPARILEALRAEGLNRVLIEGGGLTVSKFLQAGVLDRLQVMVAPMIIGSGRPAFSLPEIDTLDEALRPPCQRFGVGDDVVFDFDLG